MRFTIGCLLLFKRIGPDRATARTDGIVRSWMSFHSIVNGRNRRMILHVLEVKAVPHLRQERRARTCCNWLSDWIERTRRSKRIADKTPS